MTEMDTSTRIKFKGPPPRPCGCKGTRSCLVCNIDLDLNLDLHNGQEFQSEDRSSSSGTSALPQEVNQRVYDFCHICGVARQIHQDSENGVENTGQNKLDERCVFDMQQQCQHRSEPGLDFPGIHIFEDFVNEEEERNLDKEISKTAFMNSQSGRKKQDFGPKVNFKKRKLKTANFSGLPSYSDFLYKRMITFPLLSDFRPVEMCNLEYLDERGAHIEPHFDDFWLWGERLVTINLCSDSYLTFTKDSEPNVAMKVPMPRRSLIVVYGPARYEWKHSVQMKDIHGKRLAITFRELSAEFQDTGARHDEGQALIELALTFKGCAVGS